MSDEIKLLKSQIQDLTNKVKELEEREKRKEFKIIERVEDGQPYYTIGDLINYVDSNINTFHETHHNSDNIFYNSFNYFHTREETEKYLKRFLLELKILRTRDKINGDWKPDWCNSNSNKFCIDVDENSVNEYYGQVRSNLLSFSTPEKRKEFRELITDEEIIEFLNF